MTSWPWLEGVSVAIADPPIDPICEDDQRPAVKDLIAEHRVGIDEAAEDLAKKSPLFDKNKHDDLWILRFLLSHKGDKQKAVDAAVRTLQFRADYKLDEKDIRKYPPGPLADSKAFQNYFACIQNDCFHFEIPHPQRGVVAFIQAAGFDLTQLQYLDFEERVQSFCYMNEWTFQNLDYITRTTGRLTKSARLLDVKGVGLFQVNYETMRLESNAANSIQDFYPQLLETFYICDPPAFAHAVWTIIRPLMPARVVQKIDFVTPATSPNERARLRKFLQEEHLPTFYGGQHEM